jgi:hypothetical protein
VGVWDSPQDSIASACSLAAAYRGITADHIDLNRLRAEVSQVLAVGVKWDLEARAAADPSRFFDVSYPTLLDDPTRVTRAICEQFDYRFDPAAEQRMRRWLAENPRGKHGPVTMAWRSSDSTRRLSTTTSLLTATGWRCTSRRIHVAANTSMAYGQRHR